MGFALWFALLRKCKNCGPQLSGLEARICSFRAVFSLELREFDTPSSRTSQNWLENRSWARKKRKNTIGKRFERELKNRARNHRSSWCIFFYYFLMLYCYLNMNLCEVLTWFVARHPSRGLGVNSITRMV
jgi:hypothetical protein